MQLRREPPTSCPIWPTRCPTGYGGTGHRRHLGEFVITIVLVKFQNFNEVQKYVLDNAPGNCTLTSPDIQKQIIHCCAIETRKKIIEELGDEPYAILADESSDISHKEQLAFCLRYVDKLGILELFM